MMSMVLLWLAALGLVAVALQVLAVRAHVRRRRPPPARASPGVSLLKPLCGLDDDLEANLLSFSDLDHPDYEVLLGVRDAGDPAYPLAASLAARRPDRFRVVVQRGAPGLNPKVNQLITLARAARHEILVISDSNVRVGDCYLREIVDGLADDEVGLVTHPIIGGGAERLGSRLDCLHLAGAVTPGVMAARALAGKDIVVGKSMALRRRDVEALGGFESVKDVLAEDYVLGRRVGDELGLRVHMAARPIVNVTRRSGAREFLARYRRWSVIHRKTVGPLLYLGEVLLNPIFVALAALALDADRAGAVALVVAVKVALDGLSARALGAGSGGLLLVPLKDVLVGIAWLQPFFTDHIVWRGNRLRVLPGTRLALPAADAATAPVRA